MATAIEIAIAVISLIVSIAASEAQMKNQNSRASHETKVRSIFEAVKAKYNITIDQLNQAASKLDIDLNRLADAAKGSARLSRASEMYRQYTLKYPDKVRKINELKNSIQNTINNLSNIEDTMAGKIQTGTKYETSDIRDAVGGLVTKTNREITDYNKTQGQDLSTENNPSDIGTTLGPKERPVVDVSDNNPIVGAGYNWGKAFSNIH